MRGKRFSEEQIIGILKEVEAGVRVQDICRKYGMSDATYYKGRDHINGAEGFWSYAKC